MSPNTPYKYANNTPGVHTCSRLPSLVGGGCPWLFTPAPSSAGISYTHHDRETHETCQEERVFSSPAVGGHVTHCPDLQCQPLDVPYRVRAICTHLAPVYQKPARNRLEHTWKWSRRSWWPCCDISGDAVPTLPGVSSAMPMPLES